MQDREVDPKPPYGLIFTLGDPDLDKAMMFERQD
jgi:hypothetical protein